MPFYELAKDLKNFEDDGSTPEGFGTARHDQALLTILAYINGLKTLNLDYKQNCPIYLTINNKEVPFFITWNNNFVNDKTDIYHSRVDVNNIKEYLSCIKYKQT